jgi:hypothetical protein
VSQKSRQKHRKKHANFMLYFTFLLLNSALGHGGIVEEHEEPAVKPLSTSLLRPISGQAAIAISFFGMAATIVLLI